MPEPPSEAAVTTLVESHRHFLAFLTGRLHDRALAEDILQEAFVKSLEKGSALRDEGAAVAWFYRLLRNAVIDHQRRAGVRNRALESLARELTDAVEPPHELREAICGCVARLATTLKPEYAEILQRVEVEGAPLHAYAAEAGITANNAAVRIHRARAALRKQVQASCGTCAEHGCLECTCGAASPTNLQI
jgi:RNA polymerase sigma factor (sigma-70 family)